MAIKEQVKIALVKSNATLTEVAKQMSQTKKVSLQSLNRKVNSGTLRYNEAEIIADVLGYKIKWVRSDNATKGGNI